VSILPDPKITPDHPKPAIIAVMLTDPDLGSDAAAGGMAPAI
jgi:hypothetical protein